MLRLMSLEYGLVRTRLKLIRQKAMGRESSCMWHQCRTALGQRLLLEPSRKYESGCSETKFPGNLIMALIINLGARRLKNKEIGW